MLCVALVLLGFSIEALVCTMSLVFVACVLSVLLVCLSVSVVCPPVFVCFVSDSENVFDQ